MPNDGSCYKSGNPTILATSRALPAQRSVSPTHCLSHAQIILTKVIEIYATLLLF